MPGGRTGVGRRRPLRLAAAAVVVALLAAGGWLAYTALAARHHLAAARADAARLRQELLAGDTAAAGRSLAAVRAEAAAARSATAGPVWAAAARVPYLGRTVRAAAGATAVARSLADDVLPQLVRAEALLDPAEVRVAPDTVDLGRVRRAAAPLASAGTALARARRALAALPSHGVLGAVEGSRRQLAGELDRLAGQLTGAVAAVDLLPPMLGADGPRRYFVAFQTNAEARGTGGLVGAFGILTADHGVVRLDRVDSDQGLVSGSRPAVDLGADFAGLYGDDPGLWQNSNESAHFPYAARLWLAMWERQTGQRLDGALATDPVALGYLLGATGPVRLADGELVTADNAVPLTERDSYARFADDNAGRKQFLVAVARAVVDRVLSGGGDARGLVSAAGRAAAESRLLVYSADAAEEERLAATALGGEVPAGPGPYAYLVVNNASGTKLDYYLEREVRYEGGSCRDGSRVSTVTVTLRNTAPAAGLPAYVSQRLDAAGPATPGSTKLLVYLYLSEGARVQAATLDGRPFAAVAGRERGHPVLEFPLVLDPGRSRTVVVSLAEPAGGPVRIPVQPLVLPQRTAVDVAACG